MNMELEEGGDFFWALLEGSLGTRSCAGMRWSVPELVTNLSTNLLHPKFPDGELCEMNGGLGRD
jgi:hypothetical protein